MNEEENSISPAPFALPASLAPSASSAESRICWLGGWAIVPERTLIAAENFFPNASHRVFAPTPEGLEAVRQIALRGEADVIFGYSLGAFLLLRESGGWSSSVPLRLFAPFIDFRAENGLGGGVVLARAKILLRRLRTSPLEAVADFYAQSGLKSQPPEVLPYAAEDLIWGIEQLVQTAVSLPLAHEQQSRTRSWLGGRDALFNTAVLRTLLPECKLLEGCGHDLRDLLTAALAEGGVL